MISVTVAVVQTGSVRFGTPATLAEAEHCVRDAAARGARPRGRRP